MQVNIPAWVTSQPSFNGQTSCLLMDLDFIQQNMVNEKPNQQANMSAPFNGSLTPNQPSVTPDFPLSDIEVYLDGAPFRPEQTTAASIFIAPVVNGVLGSYTQYTLNPNRGSLLFDFPATKAVFPTPGTYRVYTELDFAGNQYVSNYAVVVLTQVPLK